MKKSVKKKIVRNRKNRENSKKFDKDYFIPIRYIILLAFMFTLPVIYKIFTPLTLYASAEMLRLIYGNILIYGNMIIIGMTSTVEIIPACVAGSAYLFLIMLNLSVRMTPKVRVFSLSLSILLLLILNIFRIVLLTVIYQNSLPLFSVMHKIFWYGISIVFVVGLWFLMVKIFNIKEIPIYTDLKYFRDKSKR